MILSAGDWELNFDPCRGGMIRALRRRGRDILRSMPDGSIEPFESACFPLAPYVNRIAKGRFEWDGLTYTLPPNHEGERHPLHGNAWLGLWTVEAQEAHAVTQIYRNQASPDWGWSYTLRQTLRVFRHGLEAELELQNTDARTMPAGIGFHPWFSRQDAIGIAFAGDAVWLADTDMLPTVSAAADTLGDWSRCTSLERPDLIDNCYAGWDGTLRLLRKDGDVLLEGNGTPFLHFYLPPGRDFFCAEPQMTMPNAVNMARSASLSPGETVCVTMRIRDG